MGNTNTPRPPYRADQVGSLLRTPELKAAHEQSLAGQYDAARLRALQDQVFAEVFEDYFGQGGWIATSDYDRYFGWLELPPKARVLDVACGWGAPALRLARGPLGRHRHPA